MTARPAQMLTDQHGADAAPQGEIAHRFGEGLLPDEAIFHHASHAARHPEAALMCAILAEAVESFLARHNSRLTSRARRLSAEAEAWLSSDNFDWVFSFRSICEALDLSPHYIRRGLGCIQQGERGAETCEPGLPCKSL